MELLFSLAFAFDVAANPMLGKVRAPLLSAEGGLPPWLTHSGTSAKTIVVCMLLQVVEVSCKILSTLYFLGFYTPAHKKCYYVRFLMAAPKPPDLQQTHTITAQMNEDQTTECVDPFHSSVG